MSTITREQVHAVSDLKAGYILGHADVAILQRLARIAIASLEAEAVPTARKLAKLFRKITNSEIDAEGNAHVALSPNETLTINEARIALTAPPAPVSVPDLKPVGFLFVSDDGAVAYSPADWPIKGFNLIGQIYGDLNACRAAMLQGAENAGSRCTIQTAPALNSSPKNAESPSGNSPVIPDGWVACSERMPDDEEDVLCFGQYGDNDIDEERYQFMGWLSSKGIKRVWRVSDGDSQNRRARVTHWMPLPAAPQREGENV